MEAINQTNNKLEYIQECYILKIIDMLKTYNVFLKKGSDQLIVYRGIDRYCTLYMYIVSQSAVPSPFCGTHCATKEYSYMQIHIYIYNKGRRGESRFDSFRGRGRTSRYLFKLIC